MKDASNNAFERAVGQRGPRLAAAAVIVAGRSTRSLDVMKRRRGTLTTGAPSRHRTFMRVRARAFSGSDDSPTQLIWRPGAGHLHSTARLTTLATRSHGQWGLDSKRRAQDGRAQPCMRAR